MTVAVVVIVVLAWLLVGALATLEMVRTDRWLGLAEPDRAVACVLVALGPVTAFAMVATWFHLRREVER